jgi:hypothetical protein
MPFRSRLPFLLAVAVAAAACGGLGNDPPESPPMIKGPDGQNHHVVDRGAYKAFYDRWGRLERIDHDSNGDGRPDRVLRHDGAKSPHRVDVDSDFDGRMDRYEEFTPEGVLRRSSVFDGGRARRWTVVSPEGAPLRYEYDDDGDGRTERSEIVVGGRVSRVELDTDRDGRVDRWQEWEAGRLSLEAVDTDGDGRPDRQLRYGPDGRIRGLERPAS